MTQRHPNTLPFDTVPIDTVPIDTVPRVAAPTNAPRENTLLANVLFTNVSRVNVQLVGVLLLCLLSVAPARAEEPAGSSGRLAPAHALLKGYYEAGNFAAAEKALRATLARAPESVEALFALGQALAAQGRWPEAVEVLEQAVAREPGNARIHRLLGESLGRSARTASVLKRLGLAKQGLSHFERAVALDPHDLEARDSLMEYYLQAPGLAGGGEAKARKQATETMAFHASEGHRLLGRIEHEKGNLAASRTAYQRAIQRAPDNLLAYLGLARLAIDEKDWDTAFDALDTLFARQPSHRLALFELGRTAVGASRRLRDGIQALETYLSRPAHAIEPSRAQALFELGALYDRREDPAGARRAYQSLLRLDPGHRRAQRALARLPNR